MIYELLARLRELAKSEYWRTRCLKAEAQLEGETWRNRAREDFLATVYVQAIGVMNPMLPRGGRAIPQLPAAPRVAQGFHDPWDDLGPVDKMEFDTSWLPLARARNIPIPEAKQQFLAEIAKRKTSNDDYPM